MSLNSFADITQKVFIIPRNQRGFAWTKQQFNSLVNDMRISLALGKDHYVGPVVVEGTGESIKTKSTRTLTMVTLEDGQQRVTTLMMMCRLLAERIKSTFQATDREYDTARDLDRCYSYIEIQS